VTDVPASSSARGLRRRDVVIAFVAYVGIQILVWAVAGVLATSRSRSQGTADLIQALSRVVPVALPASLLAAGLMLLVVLGRWRKRLGSAALARILGLSWGEGSRLRKAALTGVALALISLPLMGLVVHRPEPPDVITQLTSSSKSALWAWIISAVLLAPPIEELMFRGALFGGLGETWGLRAGATISAVTFWLMHGPEFVHWPAALAIGVLTIIATRLRLNSGALGPSIALHFGYNLTLGSFLALALVAKPPENRWARIDDACTSASGGTQGEDWQLGRTAETRGYAGGAHTARDIQRSEGVAVPTFKEAPCSDRFHRRKQRNPNLPSMGVTRQEHHWTLGGAGRRILCPYGRVNQPNFRSTINDVTPCPDQVGATCDRVVQAHQSQWSTSYIDRLACIDEQFHSRPAIGAQRRAVLDSRTVLPVT
jgi:membrane protease YdiL (CAAX protease family)